MINKSWNCITFLSINFPNINYHTKHPKIQGVMWPAEARAIFANVAGKMPWVQGWNKQAVYLSKSFEEFWLEDIWLSDTVEIIGRRDLCI